MNRLTVVVLLALAGLFACHHEVDVEADVEAIKSLLNTRIKAFNDSDHESFMSLIADDAVWMPHEHPTIIGKDALRAWNNFDEVIYNVNLTIESIEVHSDWAFAREVWLGSVTPREGGEPYKFNNTNFDVLNRKADGSWVITHSIWNSDLPPAEAE